MPLASHDFSRRTLLTVAAAGAATVALLPRASAAPPASPLTGAAPTSSTMPELEARALALKPPVFLLETAVPRQFSTSHGATMSISSTVAHTGSSSLQWDYTARSVLEVSAPLLAAGPSGGDSSTLGFWIYQSEGSSSTMRIEAGRGSHTDVWCDMGLDFTGWRTAWIRYEDMKGKLRADLDTLRFIAPPSAGTMYLDYLIVNQPLQSSLPTPDRQVPFVDPEVSTGDNEHWLDLLWFSQQDARPLAIPTPTAAQLADLATIEQAYTRAVGGKVTVTTASVVAIAAAIDRMGVPAAGVLGSGTPLVGYQNSIDPPAIAADLAQLAPTTALKTYTDEMFTVAEAYASTTDTTLQGQLGGLYLRLLDFLYDQGWTDGSAQGTIHHLGYQARGFYKSTWLMRSFLAAQGRLDDVRATLAWMVGIGRTRESTRDVKRFYNGIMDIFNTTLVGMLGSALLCDSDAEKVARVALVTQWINNGTKFSAGTEGGFKPDLATFHHMGHYPDYSVDGFSGGSPALLVLSGTSFAVSQETHQRWRDALLAMRFYANEVNWPLALTGRHPTGVTGLALNPYQTMTQLGSPDGTKALDPVMGAAFLRLMPAFKEYSAQRNLAKALAAQGVIAEASPTGSQVMNHSALVSHRRDNWLVSVRGHNRYLWSTEIYAGSNDFGRYVTYGHVQVMAGGDPVSNLGSGFNQPGWDWNRYPGTTTIHLPYDQLIANLSATGQEMLLTDQRLGGAGSIGGQNGAFLMSLHENAEYNGSFYARKSVFLFDNRVILLGEGIVNNDRSNHTETTLFQCYLADTSVPTVDSRNGSITTLPYSNASKTRSAVWLIDPQSNGYYVPKGQQLVVSRAVQTAPDQGNTTTASQPYATAVLDHGTKPRGGSYEYALVVGATAETMTTFAADMQDPSTAPYTVLRHDTTAHVVSDRATGITGCAVFERSHRLTDGLVRAVDTPSVVLVQPTSNGLALSVTDPDLRFYTGPDKSAPTASPYDVPWRDSPGQGSTITVELEGGWTCATQGVTTRAGHGTTSVTVQCADGLPTELNLTKA
ncbi:chondroitinase family polysaccharide lyase [Leekyejoonella antrihumi]|nr:chondroitinase family polysaccharide lyase [Leekyejoonella antrihumi]